MPNELYRIAGPRWFNATIINRSYGFETTLRFKVSAGPVSIAFNSLPDNRFFQTLPHLRCVSIWEFSKAERGWVESGRYQIRLNDDDDYDMELVQCDFVRWGPVQAE